MKSEELLLAEKALLAGLNAVVKYVPTCFSRVKY